MRTLPGLQCEASFVSVGGYEGGTHRGVAKCFAALPGLSVVDRKLLFCSVGQLFILRRVIEEGDSERTMDVAFDFTPHVAEGFSPEGSVVGGFARLGRLAVVGDSVSPVSAAYTAAVLTYPCFWVDERLNPRKDEVHNASYVREDLLLHGSDSLRRMSG